MGFSSILEPGPPRICSPAAADLPQLGDNPRALIRRSQLASLHRGKLRTPTIIKTALLAEGLNFEKLIQTFMVYRLVVGPGFVRQPDAIETVHFAVVPYSENPSGHARPRLRYVTPHANY